MSHVKPKTAEAVQRFAAELRLAGVRGSFVLMVEADDFEVIAEDIGAEYAPHPGFTDIQIVTCGGMARIIASELAADHQRVKP